MQTYEECRAAAIVVDSEDGVYDRTIEACLYSINSRKLCWFGHDWIDAYLDWDGPPTKPEEKRRWSVRVFGSDDNRIPTRFCKRCKVIDCPHRILEPRLHRKPLGRFTSFMFSVGTCERCKTTFRMDQCWTSHHPPTEAMQIMADVANELSIDMRKMGSGFNCELPVEVSCILEDQGEDAARLHARRILSAGRMVQLGLR
jgi:hypothetical protein